MTKDSPQSPEDRLVEALATKARQLTYGIREREGRSPDYADFGAAFAPIVQREIGAIQERDAAIIEEGLCDQCQAPVGKRLATVIRSQRTRA